VVIGGGVIAAGELLLGPARDVLARRALAPAKDMVRVVETGFGAESGMIGAALLAADPEAAEWGAGPAPASSSALDASSAPEAAS
jgi:predicted NBD/HSP70 family sugar kinase